MMTTLPNFLHILKIHGRNYLCANFQPCSLFQYRVRRGETNFSLFPAQDRLLKSPDQNRVNKLWKQAKHTACY